MSSAQTLDVASAQAKLLAAVAPTPSESVDLVYAHQRVAASTRIAQWPLPQWKLAMMDGYAIVQPSRNETTITCIGESSAGSPYEAELSPGSCIRISTGAVVPDSAFAVVPQEDTQKNGDRISLSDEAMTQLQVGRYIRQPGSELAAQSVLCSPGDSLDVGQIALLAASGHAQVDVHRKPRVAILSTGNELIQPGITPIRGQTVSTNGLMLRLQCEAAGATVVHEELVEDSLAATTAALRSQGNVDLILTCGGISVGPHDHVLPSLSALGWDLLFRKVQLQPGKPTTAGSLGSAIVIALPGNPASSYVTFELFVRPVIRRMLGFADAHLWRPERQVSLTYLPVSDALRAHYIRAIVEGNHATPLSIQRSGAMASLVGHNALVEIPAGTKTADSTTFRALIL